MIQVFYKAFYHLKMILGRVVVYVYDIHGVVPEVEERTGIYH